MLFIYAILLINNTYLILSSEDRINLIQIHDITNYKDIIEIIKINDKLEHDKIIKKYIEEFGSDNVKTATFCNNNITEDDKQLIQYIDNITDIDTIENEIKKLTMLKQKILHLQNIIKSTTINQIEEYGLGKLISDYPKYQRFIDLSNTHSLPQRRNKFNNNIGNNEITELSNYFSSIITINNNHQSRAEIIRQLINEIQRTYSYYIQYEINKKHLPNNFIYDTDVIIQIYSTIYFNKKMKKHLENFTNKNGSEQQIITKITYAYSKLI
jgi:hypothetical protein